MKLFTILFKEPVLFEGECVKLIKDHFVDITLNNGFFTVQNCDDEWLSFNANNVLQVIERSID